MSIETTCREARAAAADLAMLPRARKDDALEHVAEAIERRLEEILRDNAEDVRLARQARLPEAIIDGLLLDEECLRDSIRSVRRVAELDDPVGEVVRGWRLDNGMDVRQVRVPFGVVAVIYESRPDVTVDAAALCLKAGNAVILRGGAPAKHSNRILAEVIEGAVLEAGLPARCVSHLSSDRDELLDLLRRRDLVDVIVPRGGADLMDYLLAHSRIPMLHAAGGNCHVYVDAAADLGKAHAIVINAKCQRPNTGNAVETLLVHADVADAFLPPLLRELERRGVDLAVDKTTSDLANGLALKRASRSHYETEFLSLKLAVHVVGSIDEAMGHIAEFGTGYAEVIVTEDIPAARTFLRTVDAACVYVNASTRFTDGAEFGFGAEVGVSTQKLHARGPIGCRELTCTKYEIWGDGQVRG